MKFNKQRIYWNGWSRENWYLSKEHKSINNLTQIWWVLSAFNTSSNICSLDAAGLVFEDTHAI